MDVEASAWVTWDNYELWETLRCCRLDTSMMRFSTICLLVLGLSVAAQANCGKGNDNGKGNGCVAMPEPSAIPELVLCLAGLVGYGVWRQRKQTNPVGR